MYSSNQLPDELEMIDPIQLKKILYQTMNRPFNLAEIQLADWTQKKLRRDFETTHKNILVFEFPKYPYDYSYSNPAYANIIIIWNKERQIYGIQLQQELIDEYGARSLLHKNFSEENILLAVVAKTAFKLHQELGREVEQELLPDFRAMAEKLRNKKTCKSKW